MIQKHFTEEIIGNEQLSENTWRMRLTCSDAVLRLFRPGQFAHIKVPGMEESLLRRPISINKVDYERKEVHIAYAQMGKGTKRLAELRAGEKLDLLMPMGNGYKITDDMKKIWLIGGGIGIAPLMSVFGKFPDREYTAFLGFKGKAFVYMEEEFRAAADTYISTDDGSYCEKGFCTDLMKKKLLEDKPDVVLSCGPLPFFKALAKVAGHLPVQVSMEQHMGCGTGGCATCVCKVGGEYKRVCVNGPVFDMREVGGLYD
ncbi:MAG: dihydroorotate dehydrogenase electron transfer subunit [Christensenellaceae bacterium]|jgi:dihydroorotate dehydrogenase electron transfer subunit